MITHKTGTVIVSGARDLGSTDIAFGTAGDVKWSNELSIPLQVENAAAAPATQVSTDAREKFDAISVRVPFNGQFFDVAVPQETLGGSFENQTAIAGKIGGDIGSRELNRAMESSYLQLTWPPVPNAIVANYPLDREACALLAKDLHEGALVVCPSAPATTSLTTAKTPLQLALEMVESYTFDEKTGVSTFTVPAGVTDVEAMKALNEYFRKHHPSFKRDAVYAKNLEWYEKLPQKFPKHCQERDYSQARQITLTGVVRGTQGEHRKTQKRVLTGDSLVFSDPRDQAIAVALHACTHDVKELSEDYWWLRSSRDLWLRGSVPGFALYADRDFCVRVYRFYDGYDSNDVAASGSPSPELKKT